MNIVDYKQYTKDKGSFFRKHDNDFKCVTSPMDEYSNYHKEYIFQDGAIWYESIGPSYEIATVHHCNVQVKMLRTEYYSSDNAESKYYYEEY